MLPTSLNFDNAMKRGERSIPIVFFSNAFGVRVWSTHYPPGLADAAGDEHLADGAWKGDGAIKAGSGLGGILDRGGRVIEIGSLAEGSPDASLEEGFAQSEPAEVSVVVSNDDLACSAIEAEENILSGQVRLTLIQPGATDWNDRLDLGDYRVVEYELTREPLILECLEI